MISNVDEYLKAQEELRQPFPEEGYNWLMAKPSESDLLFEVQTPLGFSVRATKIYWQTIVCTKHPVMAGCELEVKSTLESPDEIRQSRISTQMFICFIGHSKRNGGCVP